MVRTTLAVLATVAGAVGLVRGYRPGDEICTYASSSSSCSLSSIKLSATDGSVLIYPGGKTRCAYDDFRDPATGFTSNATYFFQVFPKPTSKKLALMFQGGGACIDDTTCSFSIQCSLPSSLITTQARAISSGIFNQNDAANPLKDWNIVHMPYCTGDLHFGNRVLEPFESGFEPVFGRPQCVGQNKKMYLNGFENAKAAINWAKNNYPELEELVIGGMSAGSLGAQALATYTADLFQVTGKNIKFGILADSYIGVLPADKPAGVVMNFYGGCNGELKLPSQVLVGCEAKTLTISDIAAAVLKQQPKTDILFINSKGDNTQRLFYQLVKEGVLGYPFRNRISAEDYFAEVTKIIEFYKTVSSRVSTFFVASEQHVFLNSNGFYNTVSTTAENLGAVLTSWLANVGGTSPTPTTAPPTQTPTVTPSTSAPTPTTGRPAC